ncbi:MAG: hypothetical protein IPO77_12885 [Acidobacteria bacterium]|nr:hypothetical protein [Acidobacteriota bacterium]
MMEVSKSFINRFGAFIAMALLVFGMIPRVSAYDIQVDNKFSITGPITKLPDQGVIGEWTIVRTTIKVTATTKIDETKGKVSLGALVEVKGTKQNDGSLVAESIEVKLSPPTIGAMIKFTGKVEEIPNTPGRVGDWKVSGKTIHVSATTKIDEEKGKASVGSMVIVEGMAQQDGSISALEIEVLPDMGMSLTFRFTGKVEKLPDTKGRIGDWVISGRAVKVTERTTINQDKGQVMIGSVVEVEGILQMDRSVVASKIEVKANTEPPSMRVQFRGNIESLPATTGFIGEWKISGRKVAVSLETKINTEKGKVEVGALVEVTGILDSTGLVKAQLIVVAGNTPEPGYIKFTGVIKSLPPVIQIFPTPTPLGDWKVGEKLVHVTADTKIDQEKGRVAIGALVEVEGLLKADGSVQAIRIEVKNVFNDTLNYIRFFAKIVSVPGNTLIGDWKIGDKLVHVGERTRIRTEHGRPVPDAFVEVEGNQRSDGSVDAFSIEVERDAKAPEGTIGFINFYGPIKSLPGNTLIGRWTVGNKLVLVTDTTKIDKSRGDVVVNAFVEVYGYLIGDGSVRAIKIEVRPVPPTDNANINRSFIELIGKITKLPDTKNYIGQWVIDDKIFVNVRERTVINRGRSPINVGAMVEIYGAELPNDDKNVVMKIDAKFIEVEHGPLNATFMSFAPVTSVNAGSYLENNTGSSIIAAFGDNLSNTTAAAPSLPLPTTLGGVSVLIDGEPAGLFFVSPNQINYQVPDGVLPGKAQVTVMKSGAVAAQGELAIDNVAPSIFTADSSGQGVPSGWLLRVKSSGQQSYESLAKFDSTAGRFVANQIKRNAGDKLFLVLYGTGIRGASEEDGDAGNGVAESVDVTIGNRAAKVAFAGPAPGFAGLDQLNIEIPDNVSGSTIVITVTVSDGEGHVIRSNSITISLQ